MYSYWTSVVDAKKQKTTTTTTVFDLPDYFETLSAEEETEDHHDDQDHDCADAKNEMRGRGSSSSSCSNSTNPTDNTTECNDLVVVGSGSGVENIGGGDIIQPYAAAATLLRKAISANTNNKSQQMPWNKCPKDLLRCGKQQQQEPEFRSEEEEEPEFKSFEASHLNF